MRVDRVVAVGLLCLATGVGVTHAAKKPHAGSTATVASVSSTTPAPVASPEETARRSRIRPAGILRKDGPVDRRALAVTAEENERTLRYRGTRILPQQEAKGVDLALQQFVAARLAKSDFAPAA